MTLEQSRAAEAHRHVTEVVRQAGARPGEARSEGELARAARAAVLPEPARTYGILAVKLPALVRNAGLCQALHFVRSRGKPGATLLLGHLSAQLRRVAPTLGDDEDGAQLCGLVRDAELPLYLLLTQEALATLQWYARLARSELGIEPSQEEQP